MIIVMLPLQKIRINQRNIFKEALTRLKKIYILQQVH